MTQILMGDSNLTNDMDIHGYLIMNLDIQYIEMLRSIQFQREFSQYIISKHILLILRYCVLIGDSATNAAEVVIVHVSEGN